MAPQAWAGLACGATCGFRFLLGMAFCCFVGCRVCLALVVHHRLRTRRCSSSSFYLPWTGSRSLPSSACSFSSPSSSSLVVPLLLPPAPPPPLAPLSRPRLHQPWRLRALSRRIGPGHVVNPLRSLLFNSSHKSAPSIHCHDPRVRPRSRSSLGRRICSRALVRVPLPPAPQPAQKWCL